MPKRKGFTELMKTQTSRVMIFYRQGQSYTFSAADGHDYNWREEPLVVADITLDHSKAPTQWAKNCQISPTEWLFFGGTIDIADTGNRLNDTVGSKVVSILDTRTNRLMKVDTEIPSQMCAHQVIFIPATARSPKGAVYVFGGLVDYGHYQRANFRYDIAANSWKRLDDWQNSHYRISFNLLPLVDNRFILVVSEKDPYLFDTQRDCWIRIE